MRDTVSALRDLDGPDLHTPVVMAVGGPKAQALAAELADTVTFVMSHTETRAETMQRVHDFDNRRAVELALHVPVIGDALCAAAGWLRVNAWAAALAMVVGKLARYLVVAQAAALF